MTKKFEYDSEQSITINTKPKQRLCKKTVLSIAEENPDLPIQFIKNILIAQQEIQANKVKPYPLPKGKVWMQ